MDEFQPVSHAAVVDVYDRPLVGRVDLYPREEDAGRDDERREVGARRSRSADAMREATPGSRIGLRPKRLFPAVPYCGQ